MAKQSTETKSIQGIKISEDEDALRRRAQACYQAKQDEKLPMSRFDHMVYMIGLNWIKKDQGL